MHANDAGKAPGSGRRPTPPPRRDPALREDSAFREDQAQAPGRDSDSAQAPPAPSPAALGRGAVGPVALRSVQRTAGNTVVTRMLARARHETAADDARQDGQAGHDPAVQRSSVDDVLRSPGRPLGPELRAEMEQRLGSDFSDVRVHTGSAAQRSADEISARAYTSGSHVVIGAGGADKHTLAHELTHVVQQRQGPVAGTDNGDGLRVSDPSDRFEREAERNARRVMAAPLRQETAAPEGDRHAAGGHGRRAGTGGVQRVAVQRARGATRPPREVIADIKYRSDLLGRWIEDYDAVFDEVQDGLPPDYVVPADGDLLAQGQEMMAAFSLATNGTPGEGLHLRVMTYLLSDDDDLPAPGVGGFGTMSMAGGTEITGRPNFATATKIDLPVAPAQHRRHYIAWHNIQALLNRAYAEHQAQLIQLLTQRLGPGQVHTGMEAESTGSIANMPRAEFGTGDPLHAEILLRSAYVMNSSVNNLWVGSGRENSEINTLSRQLQGRIQEVTPQNLVAWGRDLQNGNYRSQQALRAVQHLLSLIQDAHTDLSDSDAGQHDQIMNGFRQNVWAQVIHSLEMDAPRDQNHPAAQDQATAVGNDVFDAVFSPPTSGISFDVVRRAIGFLWTSA